MAGADDFAFAERGVGDFALEPDDFAREPDDFAREPDDFVLARVGALRLAAALGLALAWLAELALRLPAEPAVLREDALAPDDLARGFALPVERDPPVPEPFVAPEPPLRFDEAR